MLRSLTPASWKPLLTAALLCLPLAVQASDRVMHNALEAAREQRWQAIDQSVVNRHVLAGYVEYHRLKASLPGAAPQRVLQYIEAHRDSPLADWMRGQAISAYGRAGQHDRVLEVSAGVPESTERQCHYYTALLSVRPDEAAAGGQDLWHTGRSQPDACDPLFNTLKARGVIGPVETWERMMLAWRNGETGLVSYLGRRLGPAWDKGKAVMERLQSDYTAVTRVPTCIGPDCRGSGALFAAAMHGFTRADSEAALEAWRKISSHLSITDTHRRTIERDLVFYALVRDVRQHRDWVDGVMPRLADADLFELRTRVALGDRDWQGVISWIDRMAPDQRGKARWQYWLGRAQSQLGNANASRAAYQRAASERDFYGFAAADRLGQPYALDMSATRVAPELRQQVANWPVVRRTEALLRIDEPGLAASEWYNAAARASERDARALADYAQRKGWYARLVQTTIAAELWDALPWRFPEAYRTQFMHWGQETGVDPYMLMGIARRESAYNPDALSSAGARGLMQLMPGTAASVSRQLGLADPGPYGVLDPATNIRLGSTYIRDMIQRYSGNRLAAAAAYNAGPHRVDRWLRDNPSQEFDLFVESIPFHETRAYVKAVMTYRVIFESLNRGGNTSGVALLTPQEHQGRYDSTLQARN
ncbi:transglycosylase SLT domain-containing protein [Halomonas almeriensis]|uniref:transglycosylase SLT domain-containing protein n=1 Tax=Halomonas almeriensis TaxID=308163 RepID=UPI0025B310C4|nr:transglycosylase SLT domain-containing protein [Halomonas almeriensis]MDN3553668.1 transglycosylase SLT domain-containing protein [Halomonas almeriensis]